ncbi:hypothetical protein SELMODRAFT_414168 [Selaginella moellendorffii]|uniref:DUF3128 domain-containing protein n=1 Tax=Selaginella moellendorffii TaxID=88036 RepID=D8RRV9_SELML|nr:uncharacterized protein LOC9656365 [Selaginella moellendorffii]XP_002983497.1 uncharacterized protein LOC9655057 [Selaginella moellendorffii]EFJ15398.1 hypothetical protein SELMODRAFT_422834 [Selaginella moellendorffii]EFJ24953.1 hypothetical protein SELMODRAFT_414168 [Selaginella moellendorffii]|eukprot:XP_002973998.1 uncharacterized protein LOC9656365 [Selaginella moellendorffii]
MAEGEDPPPKAFKFSCTPALDALWFCYSPVFQLREYYREGTFNTCTDKFWDVMNCFRLKTKKLAEAQVIIESENRKREQPLFWELRSKEEATEAWNKDFPDMKESDGL